MKIFNNIQELWDYCSFCPICQEDCRSVDVSVGPDATFEINSFQKLNGYLELDCNFLYRKIRSKYAVEHKIDCLNNLIEVKVGKSVAYPYNKIETAYFYFYMQAICRKCLLSSVHSSDLEIDVVEKKITNIGVERETVYLLKEKDKFHITLNYVRNVMLVYRCHANSNDETGFVEDEKAIELPLVNLDCSNQAKTVNKITTFILFS